VWNPRCAEYQRAVPATSGTKKVGTAALMRISALVVVDVSVKAVFSRLTVGYVAVWRDTPPTGLLVSCW
jgi:hypothetical protein